MDDVSLAFARHWWANREKTVTNRYLGVLCLQNPFDAWIMQEIITETRPEVIVECGSLAGGSALLWAHLMEQLEIDGQVVAIDLAEQAAEEARRMPIWERRVHWISGSTVEPEVIAEATEIAAGRRTMVVLDSDHSQAHVEAEMAHYGGLVSSGCYMVVQDGLVTAVVPEHGPGPLEAIERFLATDERFEVDRERERMLFTSSPSGFLRRR